MKPINTHIIKYEKKLETYENNLNSNNMFRKNIQLSQVIKKNIKGDD